MLRDYIDATIGFERRSLATQTPAKSLMRMFRPTGQPDGGKPARRDSSLQKQTGVPLEVAAVANAA